jgi:hypothetical protein
VFQNRLAQEILYLAIDASQLILSPTLQSDPEFFIDAQEK